jgi:hypothetical protein
LVGGFDSSIFFVKEQGNDDPQRIQFPRGPRKLVLFLSKQLV